MVKLTADLIARQIPGHNKRRTDESVEHYLSRLTHLPFQNRSIDTIVGKSNRSSIDFSIFCADFFFVLGCYSTLS